MMFGHLSMLIYLSNILFDLGARWYRNSETRCRFAHTGDREYFKSTKKEKKGIDSEIFESIDYNFRQPFVYLFFSAHRMLQVQ